MIKIGIKTFLLTYSNLDLKYSQSLSHFQIMVHKLICKLFRSYNESPYGCNVIGAFIKSSFHAHIIASREDISFISTLL